MHLHQPHKTSILESVASARRNRELIYRMIGREISSRYKGSILGFVWSFINPILMLCVYTIFFSVIFKARTGIEAMDGKATFAIFLFVGLTIYGFVAECISNAPSLITSNTNYVKKVIFPLETLPWVAIGSALFQFCISMTVLLLAQLLLTHQVWWTTIFLPIVLLPLFIATIGFVWFLASIGVFIRDITQATGLLTTVLLFISPVFYPSQFCQKTIKHGYG